MNEYSIPKNRLKELQRLFKKGYTDIIARAKYDELFFKYLRNIPNGKGFNLCSIYEIEVPVWIGKEGIYQMCFDEICKLEFIPIPL